MANRDPKRTADPDGGTEAADPIPGAYEPIACGIHDRLEDLATRRLTCWVEYRSPSGETRRQVARFVDIYAAEGVEYLALSTGERIRLDRIQAFDTEA